MLNATKSSIIITLFFSMSQGKNHYSVTSIKSLLENLVKFHDINIKRRWCFECLRYLIDEGYIRRKYRYVNDFDGLITQIPSMVWFTLKGVVWLSKKGVVGAKKLYQNMVKYLEKGDKRAPSRKDFDDGSYKPSDPEERARLNALFGGATKKI